MRITCLCLISRFPRTEIVFLVVPYCCGHIHRYFIVYLFDISCNMAYFIVNATFFLLCISLSRSKSLLFHYNLFFCPRYFLRDADYFSSQPDSQLLFLCCQSFCVFFTVAILLQFSKLLSTRQYSGPLANIETLRRCTIADTNSNIVDKFSNYSVGISPLPHTHT